MGYKLVTGGLSAARHSDSDRGDARLALPLYDAAVRLDLQAPACEAGSIASGWLCFASVIATLLSPFATQPFFYPMIWSLAVSGGDRYRYVPRRCLAAEQDSVLFWYTCFWASDPGGACG